MLALRKTANLEILTLPLTLGKWLCFPVPGSGNTYPKDMEALLPLMNMVIYSIDKAKKFRLNREVRPKAFLINRHLFLLVFPSGQWPSVTAATESWLVDLKLTEECSVGFCPMGWQWVSYEDFVSWGRVNRKQIRTGREWKRTS